MNNCLTKGEKFFDVINVIVMCLLMFVTIYPLEFVLVSSISNPDAVTQGLVWFWPVGFSLDAFKHVVNMKEIWVSYGNTVFYSIFGAGFALIVTACGAYPLSRKKFFGQRFISILVLLTMWFNAGIIPFYLNIKRLGLLDNRLVMIIGFACSAFYVILMRTFFKSLPDSLEESAKIDGANDLIVFFKIYLPLAKPALATVGLYYFVERWNSYFWNMILMNNPNKISLQVLLRKFVVMMNAPAGNGDVMANNTQTIIYAIIVLAVVPMLAVYPFIQKYFVKGIMLGAVKG